MAHLYKVVYLLMYTIYYVQLSMSSDEVETTVQYQQLTLETGPVDPQSSPVPFLYTSHLLFLQYFLHILQSANSC